MARLEIRVDDRPVERVPADLLCVGIFEDERPLRGGAGRVDWRLCGRISNLLVTNRVSGAAGEAALLPGAGVVAAPRILLLGAGPRGGGGLGIVESTCSDAARRAVALGVGSVVLVAPGVASDDFLRHAAAILAGLLAALQRSPGDLSVRLSLPEEDAAASVRALEGAARTLRFDGVELDLPDLGSLMARMSQASDAAPHGGRAASATRPISPAPHRY